MKNLNLYIAESLKSKSYKKLSEALKDFFRS